MNTYRSTTDIAKDIRSELKAALPGWTFSVKTKLFSMGSSITVSLMSGPEPVIEGHAPQRGVVPDEPLPGYAQLNRYQFMNAENASTRMTNGVVLTEKGYEVVVRALEIAGAHHWDESEPQTDYSCCNFYLHLNIGQWDKDYQVKGGK